MHSVGATGDNDDLTEGFNLKSISPHVQKGKAYRGDAPKISDKNTVK